MRFDRLQSNWVNWQLQESFPSPWFSKFHVNGNVKAGCTWEISFDLIWQAQLHAIYWVNTDNNDTPKCTYNYLQLSRGKLQWVKMCPCHQWSTPIKDHGRFTHFKWSRSVDATNGNSNCNSLLCNSMELSRLWMLWGVPTAHMQWYNHDYLYFSSINWQIAG